MKLKFDESDIRFASSLSAAIMVGEDLWIGGDEGVKVACFRNTGSNHAARTKIAEVDLHATLVLPGPANVEVDLEGMDWDAAGGYLWMIGSHSLKRKDAEAGKKTGKNLERLESISADGNRFFLGRLPLEVADGISRVVPPHEQSPEHFAAKIDGTDRDSDLTRALADDALLGRFLRATDPTSKQPGIPGKDNGLDFEGLAWDGTTGRLLLGLRGPVLRGSAVILEIELGASVPAEGEVGRLTLRPIGLEGRPYIRHFLDLDGLGIRDLCFDGDDLLILAGPTMPIQWPVTIYRWTGARQRGDGEAFWWRAGETDALPGTDRLELATEQPLEPPAARKSDRPEALSALGGSRFLVVCDSPSEVRFQSGVLLVDEFFLGASGGQPEQVVEAITAATPHATAATPASR